MSFTHLSKPQTLWVLLALVAVSCISHAQETRGGAAQRPAANLPDQNGDYYALVIGINKYPAPMPTLSTAVNDAKAVAELLTSRFGFKVKLLLEADATSDNIQNEIDDYVRLSPDDNLLIYYAGHGYEESNETDGYSKAYWLPVDATSGFSSKRIIADELIARIHKLPARHILVISDSCFAGGLVRGLTDSTPPAQEPAYLNKMLGARSRTLLASGGDHPVDDGGPGGHSIFASILLKALNQIGSDRFGMSELFTDFIKPNVTVGSRQIPRYEVIPRVGDEDGDFLFTRNGTPHPEEGSDVSSAMEDARRGTALLREPPYADALRLLQSSCDEGAAEGCMGLGVMYVNGTGVAADASRGANLFLKACNGGNAHGCANLGNMYANGTGFTKDASLAVNAYYKACTGRDPYGCNGLASMYEKGNGASKNPDKAAELYNWACTAGLADGCSNLGFMYESGRGVPKDPVKAVDFYRKGCDGGSAAGCGNLGYTYGTGSGVNKDPAKAAGLYRKACDGSYMTACYNLALLYEVGIGVTKSTTQALSFYRKACTGSVTKGCANLKRLQSQL